MTRPQKVKTIEVPIIRLDLGCGMNKKPDHIGVDTRSFDGVDMVLDLTERLPSGKFRKWPWKDETIDSIYCSHFLEHLEAEERVHFVNEIYRILKPDGTVELITPHWASCRAYGDLTHKWPPVAEMWFMYLSKEWRATNAPHNDFYTCDLEVTWGYSMPQDLLMKNPETQNFAMQNYKEACQDTIATLKKKVSVEN